MGLYGKKRGGDLISLRAKLEDVEYDFNALDKGMSMQFRKAVAGLARAAQSEWIRLAQDRLVTSRETYVNGLRQAESFETKSVGGEPVYTITLVGDMANNIEHGMSSFDMKAVRPGWLGGSKARTSKDGHKYVIIPFRHSTSSNARLGYSGKAAKADLKTELKKTAKEYGLNKMVRRTEYSGRMGDHVQNVIEGPVARVPNKAPVHSYLKGLTRIQTAQSGYIEKAGVIAKQRGSAQLMTWRIMSEKSAPGSWIHPGITAKLLLPEVEMWANNELGRIVETVLGLADTTGGA